MEPLVFHLFLKQRLNGYTEKTLINKSEEDESLPSQVWGEIFVTRPICNHYRKFILSVNSKFK